MMPAYRPVLALLELTLRCNLRCRHCGSTSGRARADELDVAAWTAVIDDVADLGGQELVLLGGEPLLAPGWERLAAHARARGLTPVLISNGLLIDDAMAARIAAAGVGRVGVSIDGPTPEIHDAIRGVPGSLARALAALEALRRAGLTCTVLTTVTRSNLAGLPALRDLLRGRGLGWQIQTATPHGARFLPGDAVGPRELYAVAELIADCRARFPLAELPVAGAHDIGHHSLRLKDYGHVPEWPGCQGGLSSVGVQSDGAVKPCLSLPPRFAEGNVRAAGLAAIWRDPRRFAFTRRFRASWLRGACRTCAHGSTCRGGCPDVALAATGAPFDNPLCLLRVERELGLGPACQEPGPVRTSSS
jgi:radical SAM protein with 4Fe4S-binding SPASM domain